MRIYRFNRGDEHFIFYDNLQAISYLTSDKYKHLNVNNQEFHEPVLAFKHWTDPSIEENDWIRTDDGRIVQCLKKYKLVGKGKKSTYSNGGVFLRWSIKVCFGVYTWYTTKTGKIDSYMRMVADARTVFEANNTGLSTITGKRWIAGRYLTKEKRIFAYWMAITLDPIFSYKKANIKGGYWKSMKFMTEQAFELAKDPYVIEEMSTYRSMDEIKKTIKQMLSEQGLSREKAIEHLAIGLEANVKPVPILDKDGKEVGTKMNPKTGGKNHKEWTELLFKVTEWAENEDKPGNTLGGVLDKPASLKSINNSEHEEFVLPPPREEIANDVPSTKAIENAEYKVLVTPSSQINQQRKE